ncbi:molybdopterin-synthase adenylyltransferase MoeB [Paracoccus sp. TOH]|uniref:HesA/MoeB/ThiF family protein n=1 Tax=Paracoccus sp. TOH TaxID=1263728 RepID=UPI0025B26011|nr:molybdopterin-synthase adenylyltransferase MoeB [Paracoccus sp. TOH]WJS86129.1 molybdopterin-synthase adenylyltransferase MoeB [Paracoccus sp. TOH]
MPVLILLLVLVWLTGGWWLLGYGAVLGWLYWLRLRGWLLGMAAVLLWLAVAGAVQRWPDNAFSRFVQWSPHALIWLLAMALIGVSAWLALRLLHRHSVALPHDGPGLVPAKQAAAEPSPEPADGSAPESGADPGPLSDAELDRYARHIVLRELGGPGQAALRRARVLVVGAGGLGAPVCLYLAAAGVGRITVADDDRVSLSNLQRQVIFRASDDGALKAEAARAAMLALNPHVAVTAMNRRITAEDAALVADHDLVIDGTDSFAARQAVNAACVRAGVPLVAGAIAQWEGQVTVWDPGHGAPCMACIFPQAPAPGLAPACAEAGVVGPLPGVIGSMLALEAIKLIAGAGEPLRGQMLIFDGLYGENRVMKIARRADCPVCSGLAGSGHFRQG